MNIHTHKYTQARAYVYAHMYLSIFMCMNICMLIKIHYCKYMWFSFQHTRGNCDFSSTFCVPVTETPGSMHNMIRCCCFFGHYSRTPLRVATESRISPERNFFLVWEVPPHGVKVCHNAKTGHVMIAIPFLASGCALWICTRVQAPLFNHSEYK